MTICQCAQNAVIFPFTIYLLTFWTARLAGAGASNGCSAHHMAFGLEPGLSAFQLIGSAFLTELSCPQFWSIAQQPWNAKFAETPLFNAAYCSTVVRVSCRKKPLNTQFRCDDFWDHYSLLWFWLHSLLKKAFIIHESIYACRQFSECMCILSAVRLPNKLWLNKSIASGSANKIGRRFAHTWPTFLTEKKHNQSFWILKYITIFTMYQVSPTLVGLLHNQYCWWKLRHQVVVLRGGWKLQTS